jgi:PAS domain S-box-containing protein
MQASLAILKKKREYANLLKTAQRAEDIHHHNRSRPDLLFESAGDGYWDWYIPTASVFFSDGWKQMLGYTSSEIEPSFKSWINLIHPNDLGSFLIIWSDYMDNSEKYFSIKYRVLYKDGNYLWVEANGLKDLNSENEIVRLAGFHRNISARKKNEAKIRDYQNNLEQLVTQRTQEFKLANQKLELLASQDPLTLLHNRRSFDNNLDLQLRNSRRNNTPLCLLLMDIDHFKSYNDEYEHQLGDEYLKAVANSIKNSIYHPTDIAAR